ncbi:hypothetical protein GN244_ATG00941 [Phytophthora infestans]|uniref:Uncharacterized protein n=1 Tax=Phytophthora infestans TaxID=4787 RepID=A0A833X2D6_PHYIN|nr:hypothetical protein GN244_ATG00941 [Phytophthora infestans]
MHVLPIYDYDAAVAETSLAIRGQETTAAETADHGADEADASPQVYDQVDMHPSSSLWYFDTASNPHVTGNRSYNVAFTEDTTNTRSIRGVTSRIALRIASVETVALVTEMDDEQTVMYVDDGFCIPGAAYGLFSLGLALEQGLGFACDQAARNFIISMEGRSVVAATTQDATWGF